MKKKLQISISNPCNEKWSSFTPTVQGGFCSGCQKDVIDFTSWSEDRIKAYFKNRPTNTCGRFRSDQLKVYDIEHRASFFSRTTTFLLTALFFLSSREVNAQRERKSKYQTEQLQPEKEPARVHAYSRSKTIITGIVKEKAGMPVPGANVLRRGTPYGTITDADGRFTLTIDDPDSTEVLVFSFIGFETQEYVASANQPELDVVIELSDDAVVLGGAMLGGIGYRWYTPRGLWWRIKSLFW